MTPFRIRLASAASLLIGLLNAATPKMKRVAVSGFPNNEGNAVEVVRALLRRYPGKITWLVDNSQEWNYVGPRGVKIVEKNSIRGVLHYLTAETVFYTHGLYASARINRRQFVVNLWHGDGFKRKDAPGSASTFPAHFTSGGSAVLVAKRASDFSVPSAGIILSGNPRTAQFFLPLPGSFYDELNRRTGHRRYVVWMPTFRRMRAIGKSSGWSDTDGVPVELGKAILPVVEALSSIGVALVAKPHPADADALDPHGVMLVDDRVLEELGVTTYQLLGGSDGLITDYSSVWAEYISLDRPIGFLMPDKEQYLRGRGLFPDDLMEWLPGPDLGTQGGIAEFVGELSTPRNVEMRRHMARERLGIVRLSRSPADTLLTSLEQLGAFPKSHQLRECYDSLSPDGPLIVRRRRA